MSEVRSRWHHRGVPLRCTYIKSPTKAACDDCDWDRTSRTTASSDLADLRREARDHAALEHHRIRIDLAQQVIMEPKNEKVRERAIRRAAGTAAVLS
jgi:hypothetical protein